MKVILEPNSGVSSFVVGGHIKEYLEIYPYKLKRAKGEESWDEYVFFDDQIEVYVSKNTGIIETIGCRDSCIYKSVELIGLGFDEFLLLINKNREKLEKDVLWVSDTEQQTVYEIEDMLLQVWVTQDGLINTIFIG